MRERQQLVAVAARFPNLRCLWKGFSVDNPTINRPDFESIDVCGDTVAFASLEPRAAALVLDVVFVVGSVLNWRQVSVSFLIEVLRRLGGESGSLEIRHADFGAALWAHLDESSRKEKMSKRVAALKEDQSLSGFCAVWVSSRRVTEGANGSFTGLPTLYKPGDFWTLFREIQEAVIGCDLLALPLKERRAKLRAIIEGLLKSRGCRPVLRMPAAKERKPKSNATSSEAAGAVDSVDSPALRSDGRVTKESCEQRIIQAYQFLFEVGQDWVSLGLRVPDFLRKVLMEEEDLAGRLQSAVKRVNAPRKAAK